MDRALAGEAVARRQRPDGASLAFEYALNALRLRGEAFDPAAFAARTLQPVEQLRPGIDAALARQLLQDVGGGRYTTTELGQRFLNDLQALFLPPGRDADSAV